MIPLLYSLHSGNLYGTERMALATIDGLRDEFDPVIIAPSGPVHEEARRLGIPTIVFTKPGRYWKDLRPYFSRNPRIVAIGTRVLHTLVTAALATIYRRECVNLQVVHGGTDERLSYGRKRWLDYLKVRQVAVSEYVKQRLIANGARSNSIAVIENFLTHQRVEKAIRRAPVPLAGLRRVAIVSRLD